MRIDRRHQRIKVTVGVLKKSFDNGVGAPIGFAVSHNEECQSNPGSAISLQNAESRRGSH